MVKEPSAPTLEIHTAGSTNGNEQYRVKQESPFYAIFSTLSVSSHRVNLASCEGKYASEKKIESVTF